MADSIEAVIADARSNAQVLRASGHERQADYIETILDRVARAAEPFTTWLSETDAVLRSGHSAPWLRQRFARWEKQGCARMNPTNKRERQYLEIVVPVRARLDAARAAARRAARGHEESAA
jgi:hypothetical protein